MSVRVKFRQNFKFTTTALLMMFGVHAQSQAQHHTKAVMSVSARVVSAPQFTNTTATDITGQLQKEREVLSLGNFSVVLPEGVNHSIRFDPVIKMTDNTNSWNINTFVQTNIDNQKKVMINLTGRTTAKVIAPGKYVGQLTTQIEYY